MLVLSRKTGEAICIDGSIEVKIVRIRGNRVTIGVDAPASVHVVRSELEVYSDHSLDRRFPRSASANSGQLAHTPK